MCVTLPPIREQRAIAHILGMVDDKIELNRRMNATMEAAARALYRSGFIDYEPVRAKMEGRGTGLQKDIADLFPDRLADSEMWNIPAGWHIGRRADVSTTPRYSTDPADVRGETPFIGLMHVPRNSVALSDSGTAKHVALTANISEAPATFGPTEGGGGGRRWKRGKIR